MFKLLMIVLFSNGLAVQVDLDGFKSAKVCKEKRVEIIENFKAKNFTIMHQTHRCIRMEIT